MGVEYTLRKRTGLEEKKSVPFLRTSGVEMPEAFHVASVQSGQECTSIDVLNGDTYLVTFVGGSPHWWLPGTDGTGMHQISSRGWCWDCRNDGRDGVHHLPLDIEIELLTCVARYDSVLRQRLKQKGQTAEEYARAVAGQGLEPED